LETRPVVASPAEGDRQPAMTLDDPTIAAVLNRQAAVLENVFFPAQALAALAMGDTTSVTAMRLFLARFRDEAGKAGDAVEKVLLDQLVVAHLKVGELYAHAASATNLEFKTMYGNTAARLVGCICQLASTLAVYRNSTRPRRAELEVGGRAAKGVEHGRREKTRRPTGK
jgi:hypothetical protein